MNPFARWLDHGRFQCNFCQATSECPREYMCNLGADGKRMDWQQRPELCRGSVEYAAPAEYMVRRPMAPALIFCVDVSLAAVQSGAVELPNPAWVAAPVVAAGAGFVALSSLTGAAAPEDAQQLQQKLEDALPLKVESFEEEGAGTSSE